MKQCYLPPFHRGSPTVHIEVMRCTECGHITDGDPDSTVDGWPLLPTFYVVADWCGACLRDVCQFVCNHCDSEAVVLAQA